MELVNILTQLSQYYMNKYGQFTTDLQLNNYFVLILNVLISTLLYSCKDYFGRIWELIFSLYIRYSDYYNKYDSNLINHKVLHTLDDKTSKNYVKLESYIYWEPRLNNDKNITNLLKILNLNLDFYKNNINIYCGYLGDFMNNDNDTNIFKASKKIILPIFKYRKGLFYEYIFISYNKSEEEFIIYTKNTPLLYYLLDKYDIKQNKTKNKIKDGLYIDKISKDKSTDRFGNEEDNNKIKTLSETRGFNEHIYLSKNKSFDTIHFNGKSTLFNYIKRFENITLNQYTSLDNKLGILLYGPPGTGKTGVITALANYFNRNILIIDSKTLDNDDEMYFYRINSCFKDKYIFVLDEFDLILKDLYNSDNKLINAQLNSSNEMIEALGEALKKDDKKSSRKTKSNNKKIKVNSSEKLFSNLLKFLDGLGDTSNRIVVATTNHLEYLDETMIRPGRFDVKLELSYCDYETFINIIKDKFNDVEKILASNTKLYNTVNKIIKTNITPLNVINKLVISNSIDELLNNLSKLQDIKEE
jgi:hypothetical protein